jgi:predicted RNA-binding protein YlqC (UPF0109 family)
MADLDIIKVSIEDIEKLCSYIKSIYAPICFYPEEIKITYKRGELLLLEIEANPKDDGILIGRRGSTIGAIRLLTMSYAKAVLGGVELLIRVRDHHHEVERRPRAQVMYD